jgi:hypothetical protein
VDPITPLKDLGLALGGVVVCTSLFIWNTIQIQGARKDREELPKAIESLSKELAQNAILLSKLTEDQHNFMVKTLEHQNLIANNLVNLTNSVNEVVRELIDVIREVDK